jgi:zinc protease
MPINMRLLRRTLRCAEFKHLALLALILAGFGGQSQGATSEGPAALRSTLPNGMRVVLVRNTLAPVVTVEMNYLVGGNETPPGFPGMAHAQEHMAFRGCNGMSADQTAAIYAQLGGQSNADTQQNITQYFATVPAADLDVALQAQAACLLGIDDAQEAWEQERGAIEQEVSRDLSNPTYKFIVRLNEDLFADTPYAHDPLGTKSSFDATSGEMLKAFYETWYAPKDAILVVVGDIDPAATMAKVTQLFGKIPSHSVPTRPSVHLRAVKSERFTLESNLPYVLGFIAYRLPGTSSPDYAAVQVLADVLASQRADLYGMVPAGKALAAEFGVAENYPKASVGFAVLALPVETDPAAALQEMRGILHRYAMRGVPEDLVAAAKRSEVASAEFQRNSIPGLANVWSNALAAEGRFSPDEDIEVIKRVTVADVDRVAKRYLMDVNSVTAVLKPVPTGQPVASKGFGGAEQITSPPTKPVQLPAWASDALTQVTVPGDTGRVSDSTLPNGIRLIVKTDPTSETVSLLGSVKHEPGLQTPAGAEGVSDLLQGLFSYGTQTLDRLEFQKALDDVAANESAGYAFSVAVLKDHFSRAVQLLADNELHPALPAAAFPVVQQQTSQFIAGRLQSPNYKAARALDVALLPAQDPSLRQATPATLSTLTLEQVKQYYAATFRPDLTTIVVIGDVSPEEAKSTVERWFGDWKATGPVPGTTLSAVPVNKASAANVADPPAAQDSVVLAEQLNLNRFEPDYYALQLGNHVLGGGFYATRLYHDLRQVAGYVYTVDVSLDASKTRALYKVTYGCNPENVSKARALVERDLADMRNQDVSPAELQQAKALLLRQIPLSESSEDAVARGLVRRAEIGLPLDEPILAAQRYHELQAEQVKAAFFRLIRIEDLVQVVSGPPPR